MQADFRRQTEVRIMIRRSHTPERLPVYNTDFNSDFQGQLYDWHSQNLWTHCRPHNACQRGYIQRSYCIHDFCKRHGQFQRIDKAERILALGKPDVPAYAVTLPYGAILAPPRVAKARKHFLKQLCYHEPEVGYLWRLHFIDFVPHLHMILLVNDNRSNDKPNCTNYIKPFWNESLSLIGHPHPSSERVQCEPVKTYKAWVRYVFQTGKTLSAKECPPKIPFSRWSFWDWNKAFQRYCMEGEQTDV